MRFILVVFAAIWLGGCSWNDVASRFVPEDADGAIGYFLDAFVARDSAGILDQLDGDLSPNIASEALDRLYKGLPEGPPASSELIGAELNTVWSSTGEDVRTLLTRHHLIWNETSYQVYLTLRSVNDGPWRIYGLNFLALDTTSHALPGFDERTDLQKAYLISMIAVPVFILLTLIASFRTPRLKRRILWAVFILVGMPVFGMNGATGDISLVAPAMNQTSDSTHIELLAIRLFGASATQSAAFEPWIFELGLPIGALFFWYRRLKGGPTRKPEPVAA